MVSKRKFNRIKKENPESRIGQRTREEQQVRNRLAKTLIDAKKKGVKTPLNDYIMKKDEMRKAGEDLKTEKASLKAKENNLKAEKTELRIEKDKFETEKAELEKEKNRLKKEISELNLSIDDKRKIIEKYKEIIGYEIDIKKLFDDLPSMIDSVSDYALLLEIKKCIEEGGSVRVKIENKEKEFEEEKRKIKEEKFRKLKEKQAKEEEKRKNHLKENWNKRPLYDEDGNPIKVSDEKVKFLDTASNIEKYCKAKGIDTIYFIGKVHYKEANAGGSGWHRSNFNGLFEYRGLCQKEDGTMYYTKGGSDRMEYYEDAKRFRKNMFPNMNVVFLEGESHVEHTLNGYNHRITCDFPKSKGALLIGECYRDDSIFEKFKLYNGECIEYHCTYEPEFIEGKGIENFSDKKS